MIKSAGCHLGDSPLLYDKMSLMILRLPCVHGRDAIINSDMNEHEYEERKLGIRMFVRIAGVQSTEQSVLSYKSETISVDDIAASMRACLTHFYVHAIILDNCELIIKYVYRNISNAYRCLEKGIIIYEGI